MVLNDMNIYLTKEGDKGGPYTIEQVVELIRRGDYLMTDLAWREGMSDWKPIHTLADIAEAVLPPVPTTEQSPPIESAKTEGQPAQPPLSILQPIQLTKPSHINVWTYLIWVAAIIAGFVFAVVYLHGEVNGWLVIGLVTLFSIVAVLIISALMLVVLSLFGRKQTSLAATVRGVFAVGISLLWLVFLLFGGLCLLGKYFFGQHH